MRAPAVSAGLFPFNLEFSGNPPAARFPFIFDGRPVETLPGGRPAPRCAVSGRAAGDMRYDPALPSERREAFFRSLGIDGLNLYSLVQVHSRTVFTLGSPAGESSAGRSARQSARLPPPEVFSREGDGMVSFAPSPCLAVTAADCLPVFLLDTQSGALAVLHSGWRGTGIVLRALALMEEGGCAPGGIAAVLGPCIQGCCYRVDRERAAAFEGEFGPSSPHVPPGTPYPLGPVTERDDPVCGGSLQAPPAYRLRLQAANARLLAGAGVRNIAYCRDCTFTDERLGSYRREGPRSYTRMAAAAGYF